MADSSEIDAALSNKLLTDSQLASVMSDGVYFDIAKKGATKFVIISLLSALDEHMFQGRAYEGPLYLVKAVALSTTGADVKAAAARIDTLLDGGSLTIAGYGLMMVRREERVRYTEVDEDNDNRWQHRGGHYLVYASPA